MPSKYAFSEHTTSEKFNFPYSCCVYVLLLLNVSAPRKISVEIEKEKVKIGFTLGASCVVSLITSELLVLPRQRGDVKRDVRHDASSVKRPCLSAPLSTHPLYCCFINWFEICCCWFTSDEESESVSTA